MLRSARMYYASTYLGFVFWTDVRHTFSLLDRAATCALNEHIFVRACVLFVFKTDPYM